MQWNYRPKPRKSFLTIQRILIVATLGLGLGSCDLTIEVTGDTLVGLVSNLSNDKKQRITQLMEDVKGAKTDESRTEAEGELVKYLEDAFDRNYWVFGERDYYLKKGLTGESIYTLLLAGNWATDVADASGVNVQAIAEANGPAILSCA